MALSKTLPSTIAAYFEDDAKAREAVEALHEAGFLSAHIGVAHRANRGASSSGSFESGTAGDTKSRTSASGTRAGETFEGSENQHPGFTTWDKVKSWFSGSEPEPYEDEHLRRPDATREITDSSVATAGYPQGRVSSDYDTGGYDPSDLHGSFAGLDIPEDRSKYFTQRLQKGRNSAGVTVRAGERRPEAEEILTRYGGDLGDNASTYDYGDVGADAYEARTAAPNTARAQQVSEDIAEGVTTARDYDLPAGQTANTNVNPNPNLPGRSSREDLTDEGGTIQLLGEVLRVHKDRINRGEVRIRKEVVTETQTIQVPVSREELVIERRPGNENTPAMGQIGESEIRIPLSEEMANIDKSTVVREEVSVGKRPVEEVRDLTGQVRREELVVEDPTDRSSNDPNRRVA